MKPDKPKTRNVPQELLNEAWAQADELNENLEGLSDEDIIDLRECIHERVRKIMAFVAYPDLVCKSQNQRWTQIATLE